MVTKQAGLTTAGVRELWRRHAGRVGRFAVVGLINTGVDIGLFALLFYHFHLSLVPANSLSYGAGTLNGFILNKLWTFEDHGGWLRSWPRLLLFVGFNGLGLLWANLIIWLLAQVLPVIAAKCGAVVGVFAWNYWTSHRFVFVRSGRSDSVGTCFQPTETSHVLHR
ncbi:MAG: hypothetical protein AUK55_00010 [Syntrophobacteraceae bacterium CG2_30_61_12]|nr:MAG: hypothetical protein AUK55_00010 [Syntrophobacteraceae bacterium CG2_30_61_12]